MVVVVMVMMVVVVMFMIVPMVMVMVVVMFMIVLMVMMVVMVMDVIVSMGMGGCVPVVVGLLLLTVDGHRHVGTCDAAGHRRLRRHPDAGQSQTVHLRQKLGLLFLGQELVEGGGEHIAGAPHGALDIKRFHVISPPVLPFD